MTKTMDEDIDSGDLIRTKTLFQRHSKGPVMFNGCSPLGDVIVLDNISPSRSYDLTGWYIERQTDSEPLLRYTFTDPLIIPPMTTVELWSSASTPISIANEPEATQQSETAEQQSYLTIKTKILTWNMAKQWSINRLFNSHGREKAIFSHRILTPIEQEEEAEE